MDKKNLLKQVMEHLERDRFALLEATKATLEAATHEESKPENEYDTRGLEASYLAGAQSKRVGEIEEALLMCKNIQLKNFSLEDAIAPTALIELDLEGRKSWVFLLPNAGGVSILNGDHKVQVITGTSPLGEALLGLKVGDAATVESGSQVREYEVVSIL